MPKGESRREKGAPSADILKIAEKMEDALSGDASAGRRASVEFAIVIDRGGEPRLPVLARDQLRRKIRKHPSIKRHVERPEAVSQMPKADLLALAKKLGINAKAIVEHAIEHGKGMESVLEEEELDRWRHSLRWPAFRGHYPFDITLEIRGERVTRQARVEYKFTPEWEYFDTQKQAPYVGWPGIVMSMEILTVPEEYDDAAKPTWVEVGELLSEHVLPSEIIDDLRDAIEEKCRKEDSERRQAVADKPQSIIDAALADGRLPTLPEVLEEQRRLFREKFGRDPRPDEPVFFDPDQDQPSMWSEEKLRSETLEAMRKAGTPPQIVYAYAKTGLILLESTPAPPDVRAEWNAAVKEYFAMERKAKARD